MREIVYVADPMCSWCYGFAPTLRRLESELAPGVSLRYVMGGLAPDSDDPMPQPVREMIQGAWDSIERVTDVTFNRAFWEECEPRRSTYAACRAVIAAQSLRAGADREIFRGIQRAYYQDARNPSDEAVLVSVAEDAGLARSSFEAQLRSPEVEDELQRHLLERARLGVRVGATGFPTLAMYRTGERAQLLTAGYCPWSELQPRLRAYDLVG